MEFRMMLVSLSKLLKDDEFRTMKFLCSEFIKKREMESVESIMDLWENLESKEKIAPNNLTFLKDLLNNACNGRQDVFRIIQEYENNSRNPEVLAHRQNPAILNQHTGSTPAYMQKSNLHCNAHTSLHYLQFEFQKHFVAMPSLSENIAPAPVLLISHQKTLKGMKREIDILTQQLGREWRFFMRALGVSDREMVDIEEDCPRNMREQIYRCLVLWVSDDRHNPSKDKIINALRDSCVERNDIVCLLNAG
ncbi:hypothetical protein KUTeg_003288 [Tegillarca granosa]|uniref:Death domain-containing protein n=1 Tax=Tegillarca granosa TaxID=220873 RepID=A0ABQ9FNJ3_TEGGR|nr:hypothetical protein KUTeg_003288 [Tegillarca granosa]